jgi:hypothetical protein
MVVPIVRVVAGDDDRQAIPCAQLLQLVDGGDKKLL